MHNALTEYFHCIDISSHKHTLYIHIYTYTNISHPSFFVSQIGGVWGGCVQAYKDFSDKWASVLDQNMTDAEIAVLGKQFTSYLSCIPM
jgi:hypothetical protein